MCVYVYIYMHNVCGSYSAVILVITLFLVYIPFSLSMSPVPNSMTLACVCDRPCLTRNAYKSMGGGHLLGQRQLTSGYTTMEYSSSFLTTNSLLLKEERNLMSPFPMCDRIYWSWTSNSHFSGYNITIPCLEDSVPQRFHPSSSSYFHLFFHNGPYTSDRW